MQKFANFRTFKGAVNFAASYVSAGAVVSAPVKYSGLWVVKYQLTKGI